MKPHPQSVPFFRRILPWLYVLLFLILAPILVSYTSGYRYNPKKGQMERHSALVIDSTPKGAEIFLDGQNTHRTTPITLQDVTPGTHTLLIKKDGYHTWQKTISLKPEQAAFANQIWLWRNATSTLTLEQPVTRLALDPTEETLAFIVSSATSTHLGFLTKSGLTNVSLLLSNASSSSADVTWREDGQALLWGLNASSKTQGWISLQKSPSKNDALPPGIYRWSKNELLGLASSTLLRLDPRTSSLTRERLPAGIVDRELEFTLEDTGAPNQLALVRDGWWKQKWILPLGLWRVAQVLKPFVLLKKEGRYLAIKTESSSEAYGQELPADQPHWLAKAKTPTGLFLTKNEVWLWALGEAPIPLWRQSDPLVQAAWHKSGSSVFIATKTELFALELNDRDGRQVTNLTASAFENIEDFTVMDKFLLVAGTKDGKTGLWTLLIE